MNLIVFAIRPAVTKMVLAVALISGGLVAFSKMRIDIFRSLSSRMVFTFLDDIGMSPEQVERFLVGQLELFFQHVDGVLDINTRNIHQLALCEMSFSPAADMGQAMSRSTRSLPRRCRECPKGLFHP